MEERKKNPMKQLAMHLAHSMEDQRRAFEENLNEWQREEIREYHKHLSDEIIKHGYDIGTMLDLAEQYKTLKWNQYIEWVYI